MDRARARQRLIASLALLACLSPVACKEGDPLGADIAPARAVFEADSVAAQTTERYVTLRSSSANAGRITLDVVLTEIDEPVSGIALKLTYPDAFSRFVRCTDGSLFPPGQCFFAEPAPGSGEVFIGRSVTGISQATPVVGSRVVVRIEFLVFGVSNCTNPADCRITIEGQNLGGGDASAVLDLDGDPILVQWFSGELRGE